MCSSGTQPRRKAFPATPSSEQGRICGFDRPGSSCRANKLAQESAYANPKIEFLFRHEPREFVADDGKTMRLTTGRTFVELPPLFVNPVDDDGAFATAIIDKLGPA